MVTNALGLVTNVWNNEIDFFFLTLLLLKEVPIEQKKRKWVMFYYLGVQMVISAIVYLMKEQDVPREFLYQCMIIFGSVIMPILVARSVMMKYVLAYGLNMVVTILVSFVMAGTVLMFFHTDTMYFYVEDIEKLLPCIVVNVVYIGIYYILYCLARIVLRAFDGHSKAQGIFGVGLLLFSNLSGTVVFYLAWLGQVGKKTEVILFYMMVILFSFVIFFFALYQNRQLLWEQEQLRAHREKEMEYYRKLDAQQAQIRKMRHDMKNYFRTMRYLKDKGDRERMLAELERKMEELM